MALTMPTLLQYLRKDNPPLKTQHCIRGKNTKSMPSVWVRPEEIRSWEDFDLESLKTIYSGELNEVLQCHHPGLHDHAKIPQFPFCEIRDEDSLNTLLNKWTYSTVTDALVAAQSFHRNSQSIYMVKGAQADYPGSLSNFRPDWAGVLRPTSQSRPTNILPGDTKLNTKWSSAWIRKGPLRFRSGDKDWRQPLLQIFTYCTWANARYGYIITDAELVVVRVRPGSETESQERDSQSEVDTTTHKLADDGSPAANAQRYGILEYRAIPWINGIGQTQGGITNMTVNLALWWLHIMAADNNAIENVYPPLRNLSRDSVSKDPQYSPTLESLNTTPKSRPHGKRLQTRKNLSMRPHNRKTPERDNPRKRARDQDLDLDNRIGQMKRSRD